MQVKGVNSMSVILGPWTEKDLEPTEITIGEEYKFIIEDIVPVNIDEVLKIAKNGKEKGIELAMEIS